MRALRMIAIFVTVVSATSLLGACAGGGSPRVSYSLGMGYGGYYGRAPYGYYRPPVIIGGPGPDIDRPVAMPLPEPDMDFGMPDAGFDDFGDFDF
ncbi:MAG: hypothetical protein ACN4GT_14050 [Gammaproteobacteria bacterium]